MSEKTHNKAFRFADLPDRFEGLCQHHALRPIHDAGELAQATEIIDAMAGHDLNADQADYLDTIATLVERYEDEMIRSIPRASPGAICFTRSWKPMVSSRATLPR